MMAAHIDGAKFGRGQIKHNADMNVTPFVDVMLVLLFIFMVAAPLATTAIKVDAPPPAPTTRIVDEPTYVRVAADGYYVTGQRSSLTTLARDVARSFGSARPTDEPVLIRADRDVDYGRFMAAQRTEVARFQQAEPDRGRSAGTGVRRVWALLLPFGGEVPRAAW